MKRKFAIIFALVSLGLLLCAVAVYAQTEGLGCSDEVSLKLTSPPTSQAESLGCSDEVDVVLKPASSESSQSEPSIIPFVIGGGIGVVAVGLAIAYWRFRKRAKLEYRS